jgi:Transposase and inactivated derivatives
MLRKDGIKISKKFVQKVRRQSCLQVATRKPKTIRQGLSTGLPTKATHKNHVWCWDFMFDKTQRGGGIKIFNLIDEYTRECHAIHIDRALKAEDVKMVLLEAIEQHGAPEFIRSDNGSEFIARPIQEFFKEMEIKSIYIAPGSPWQNGFAESFNSKFRAEFLERELIYTLMEARVLAEDWRIFYNETRPHRSLEMLTPKEFAESLDNIANQCATSPRGSIRDVYDRYANIVDIYKEPYLNLINETQLSFSHKMV